MMIHKIEPHKYYPEFRNQEPKPSDYLLLFDGEKVFLPSHTGNDAAVAGSSANEGIVKHPQVYLPTFEEIHKLLGIRQPMERFFLDCEYLFSIDDRAFFRKTAEDAGALMLPEMTSILPVYSVILNRNIWRSPGSQPPRSTVSVWTGSSAAAAGIPQFTAPQSGPASARSADRLNIPRSLPQSLSPSWIPCGTRSC